MFSIPSNEENKRNLIRSIDQSQVYFCLLNSNEYHDKYSRLNWQLVYGKNHLSLNKTDDAFGYIKDFHQKSSNSIYGFLSYDLKNSLEKLSSTNKAIIDFPEVFFFEEDVKIEESNGKLESTSSLDFDWIESVSKKKQSIENSSELIQQVSKEEYIQNVKKIQEHILEGDVYELNYCIPFEVNNYQNNPIELYFELNKKSPNPFSGILKIEHLYILSASPERYLCKRQNKIISQPIKGTIKKTDDLERDKRILQNSEKERAENVMIVDLVRNDLTKSAQTGSIKVEELFGIYTFPQLHQMISTVSAELKENYTFIDAIKNSFPMGSMTGAPKVKAMELIEEYEVFKRSAYSGALGYIDKNGEADFNVLIRSVFIDTKKNKLNFNVGSAITIDSNPEEEYDECLLKAKGIFESLYKTSPQPLSKGEGL